MRDHSLAVDPSWVTPFRTWSEALNGLCMDNDALDIWLCKKVPEGLEAIIGICDPISLWIYGHCAKLGYSVPDDIAVAGYDGFVMGRVANPPLTTVDPSWTELGVLALETIIDIIGGNTVPEKRMVKAKLIIARSCGCLEENVKRAATVSAPGNRVDVDDEVIIDEIMRNINGEENERIRSLYKSMLTSFTEEKPGVNQYQFLTNLGKALTISMNAGNDVLEWQNALSVLHKYTAGSPDSGGAVNSNILCHQGRVLIGNTASRIQEQRRLALERLADKERNLGLNLITTFDLSLLLDLLSRGLPGIGISRFYVSFYEDPKSYVYPEPAPEWSRLILAHNDEGRIGLDPDGILYRTQHILPESVWPNEKPLNLSVNALYFQDTQIGLIIFDAVPRNQNVFEVFRVQLSSALKGVLLVKKVEFQMQELTASNEELVRSYSELKRNQQILLASEKMASLGRLSAGIAHEMNTPLAAVRSALHELGYLVIEKSYLFSCRRLEIKPGALRGLYPRRGGSGSLKNRYFTVFKAGARGRLPPAKQIRKIRISPLR